jgi:hypothetical protein
MEMIRWWISWCFLLPLIIRCRSYHKWITVPSPMLPMIIEWKLHVSSEWFIASFFQGGNLVESFIIGPQTEKFLIFCHLQIQRFGLTNLNLILPKGTKETKPIRKLFCCASMHAFICINDSFLSVLRRRRWHKQQSSREKKKVAKSGGFRALTRAAQKNG